MVSPFELALRAGLRASRQVAGVSVTYVRGATTLTVSKAIPGDLRQEVLPQDGVEAVVEFTDWRIEAAALTLGEPAIGDTIARVIDGVTHAYTVESPGIGLKHWDWSDSSRSQYIIRTRKDGATAFDVTTPNGFDLSGGEIRYE